MSQQTTKRWGGLAAFVQSGFAVAIVIAAVFAGSSVVSCKNDVEKADASLVLADGSFGPTCDAEPNGWRGSDASVAATDDSGAGLNLFGVWGVDENTIFAVGDKGVVLRWTGSVWQRMSTPTEVTLTAVYGTSEKDVWAVGYSGVVLHFDGTSWTDMSPPTEAFMERIPDAGVPTGDAGLAVRRNLWGVWARGKDDATETLYVVGDSGTLLHYAVTPPATAPAWVRVESGVLEKLTSVWGANNNAVYIVGNFAVILQGNAAAGFTRQDINAASSGSVDKALRAVWGRGANDVYAVGLGGTVLHYNGSQWRELLGAPPQFLRAIWGPSNDNRRHFIVGWDGVILTMNGRPPNVTFDKFNCVTSRRLEWIWGTLVDGPFPDGGADVGPLDGGVDIGYPQIPAVWAVGASGYIMQGP